MVPVGGLEPPRREAGDFELFARRLISIDINKLQDSDATDIDY